MKTPENHSSSILCCPLCQSDEFLLSENNHTMLCAHCGSLLEDVNATQPIIAVTAINSELPMIHSGNCSRH